MGRTCGIVAGLLVGWPSRACADGVRAEPGQWWRAWNGDPLVLLVLALLVVCYARGRGRLLRRGHLPTASGPGRALMFYAAIGCIALGLLSPLDALSAELASVHMVQHMLLMMVAAPLLVAAGPAVMLAWGMPEVLRGFGGCCGRYVFRVLNTSLLWNAGLAWLLFAVTMWAWHHPRLYETALRDPIAHDAQHMSFFVAGCLYWRVLLDPLSRRTVSAIAAIPYLFLTSLHASALGVFMALSPVAWYAEYASSTAVWGLSPLEDQQLAGFLMWMPACLIFPAVGALRMAAWLIRTETMVAHVPEPCRFPTLDVRHP